MTEDHIDTRRCHFLIKGGDDLERFELEEGAVRDFELPDGGMIQVHYDGRIVYSEDPGRKDPITFNAPVNTGKHPAVYLYMPEAGGIRLTIGDNNYFYGFKEPPSIVVRIQGSAHKIAHDSLVRLSEAVDSEESNIGGIIDYAKGGIDALQKLGLLTEADAEVWKDRYEKVLTEKASK